MLPMLTRDFEIIDASFWGPVLRQFDGLVDQQTVRQSDRMEGGLSTFSPRYEADETDDHYVMTFE